MMNELRRRMPLILWILVIAFVGTIIFSWGMGGFQERVKPGVVGIVAGEEVTSEMYENMVSQEVESRYQQTGVRPEGDALTEIRNQIWNSLVEETLIGKEIKRRRLTVSDSEIVNLLLNNPFDYVRRSEYFQTEGKFDLNKYHSFLADPRNSNQVLYWEATYRQTLLQQKLISQVISMAEVTEPELFQAFAQRNTFARAKYALLPTDSVKIDSALITEDEIENYYFIHKSEYLVKEQRRIAYTRLDYYTTGEDSADTHDLALEISQRLKEGADFASLAAIYSEHHTAQDSGYLGWRLKGTLEEAGDSVVWQTKVDDWVGPIESRNGLSFYKVQGRKIYDDELQSELRIIQLKFEPSADSRDMVTNKMLNFVDDAKENGFLISAEAYDLKVDSTDYFENGSFIPGLGRMKSAVDYIFSKPVGTISEIYPTMNGWMVFKIIGVIPEHHKPMNEVREEIFTNLLKDNQFKTGLEKANQLVKSLENEWDWYEKAEEAGWLVGETESDFRLGDYIRNLGRDLVFTASALRAELGELYGPVKGQKGIYLIELTEKSLPDSANFRFNMKDDYTQALKQEQEQLYRMWFESLKERYKVEDYRYMYYRSF